MKRSWICADDDTVSLCLVSEMNDDALIMRCHLDTIRRMFSPIKVAQAQHSHPFSVGGSPLLRGKSFITSDNDNKCFLPHTMPFITTLIPP